MSVFGDLDVSVIKELPIKRGTVVTRRVLPEKREQMGRNARQLAETRFCRDKLSAQVLAKIKQVCLQHSGRGSMPG